jgi:hypothetical protein
MTVPTRWEYRVVTVGSIWGTGDQVIEATLNELGQDGWEAINTFSTASSAKVTVVLKRPLTLSARRRRERDQMERYT